jgi:hypothetical protein
VNVADEKDTHGKPRIIASQRRLRDQSAED